MHEVDSYTLDALANDDVLKCLWARCHNNRCLTCVHSNFKSHSRVNGWYLECICIDTCGNYDNHVFDSHYKDKMIYRTMEMKRLKKEHAWKRRYGNEKKNRKKII